MTTERDGTATDWDPEAGGTAPVVAFDAAGAGTVAGVARDRCPPAFFLSCAVFAIYRQAIKIAST